MKYFPLFADLNGRRVLVVGGGDVAERKVRLLLEAGAQVDVVAPVLNDRLSKCLGAGAGPDRNPGQDPVGPAGSRGISKRRNCEVRCW